MQNIQTVWDPLGESINVTLFQHDLREKLKEYQKSPYLPLLYLLICCLITITALFLAYYFSVDDGEWYIISFIPPFLYITNTLLLQHRLILLMLSEKNNWQYDPTEESTRAQKFIAIFPQIFEKGRDQTFSEQLWGSVSHQQVTTPFWATKFSYVVGHGKRRTTYNEYVFAFPLPKILPASFILEQSSLFDFSRSKIETESHEFNKTFSIIPTDESTETKQKIIQVLSPSIQTRLTDFAKMYKPYAMVFHHNLLLLTFGTSLWKTKHTNLFLSPTISDIDVEQFKTDLITMAELPSEMIQFID